MHFPYVVAILFVLCVAAYAGDTERKKSKVLLQNKNGGKNEKKSVNFKASDITKNADGNKVVQDPSSLSKEHDHLGMKDRKLQPKKYDPKYGANYGRRRRSYTRRRRRFYARRRRSSFARRRRRFYARRRRRSYGRRRRRYYTRRRRSYQKRGEISGVDNEDQFEGAFDDIEYSDTLSNSEKSELEDDDDPEMDDDGDPEMEEDDDFDTKKEVKNGESKPEQ